MKHSNLYSQFKALDRQEREELKAAVMAHGGVYDFEAADPDSTNERPIILGSAKHDDETQDWIVNRVEVVDGIMRIFGERKNDPFSGEDEIYYIEFNHVSFITDYIPETEDVQDVTIFPAVVPIINLDLQDIKNAGFNPESARPHLSEIAGLMRKYLDNGINDFYEDVRDACEVYEIERLAEEDENDG